MNGDALSRVADELVAIKRLIVFSMMKNGMGQSDIAEALGTSQSSVSRMFSSGGASGRKSVKGKVVADRAGAADV